MIHDFKGSIGRRVIKGHLLAAEQYLNYFSSCRQDELQPLRCPFVYSFLLLEYEISLKGCDIYYTFMKIENFKQNLIQGFFSNVS